MTNWRHLPDLEPGCAMFRDSRGGIHSVPLRFLRNARAIDPDLTVLATSPEGWRAFVEQQLGVDQQWANRNTVTDDDRELLRQIGIAWHDPSLEELLLAILPVPAVPIP
jgi:hypothetical protein